MKSKKFIKLLSLCLILCNILCATTFSASATPNNTTTGILEFQEIKELPDGGKIYVYNIDGIINEFPVPPEGFNPLNASNDVLETYGFPIRPTDSDELAKWILMMKKYKKTPIPEVEKTDIIHGLNKKIPTYLSQISTRALDGEHDSRNWSGYVAKGNFSQVQGDFVQPAIPDSEPSYTHESTWVGLGGHYENSGLVQTGTVMATHQGGRQYYAWYEYISPFHQNPEIRMNSVTVNPGDRIHAYCSFQKANNKFNAYIANDTNGTSQAVLVSISASEYFDQRTAEFINEHPSWGAIADNGLTNYGTTNWSGCQVYTMSGSWINLGSTTYDRITMRNANGNVLAAPFNLNGASFVSTWRRHN